MYPMMTKEEIRRLNKKKKLSVEDFTGNPDVRACVDFVTNNPKKYSDVLDKEGNQYVDLVQKGGGVLGVALVGYVYILEKAGIRFLRLAGTSAGAINTSLMAIQQDKTATKSEYLIQALSDLKLFRLVDGHPFARGIIKRFVKEPDFFKRIKKFVLKAAVVLLSLLSLSFVSLGLQQKNPDIGFVTCIIFVLTGLYFLCIGVFGYYISTLLQKLKTAGFGINPGDFFYDWVKFHMTHHKIQTVDALIRRAQETPILHMREGREKESIDDLVGDVVFIASELVTQNKFELPRMANLFRAADDRDDLQPAGFVRASMSIPLFFESYYIRSIPCNDPGIKKLWQSTFNFDKEKKIPSTLRFVDGGILSNFPINLFYKKNIGPPRLPTFGIDLDDTSEKDKEPLPQKWTFGGYLGRMFNTIRFYYDKDFTLQNRVMKKGVGTVKVAEYNWLNFFLNNSQKVDLFVKGAQAAMDFLKKFEWEEYKTERTNLP